MAWVDVDYLAEGVEKACQQIRARIKEMERSLDADDDSPPALVALYALDDGPLAEAGNDDRSLADRMAAMRAAMAAVHALPDEALAPVRRLLLANEIEEALHREERNNNPEEPYRGY